MHEVLEGLEEHGGHGENPLMLPVTVTKMDGSTFTFNVVARVDAPIEWEYYRHGGILPMVLRRLAAEE